MAKQVPDTDKGRDTVRDQTRFQLENLWNKSFSWNMPHL